ncbi:hypothetical protein LTR53_012704 [Teratosphaeriaceae sp. CCFEE 6253]|nr:hypothetical protein LTR53_012704 [Teratosphaeriaceae sp. CCFEE 6253]
MPAADDSKRKAARDTIAILHEISTLLNTNLDRQSLSYCVSLIENGVNPEALAVSSTRTLPMESEKLTAQQNVIKELRVQNARHDSERAAAS